MNLAIVDWFGYNMSPQERMRLIKEAGFDGVLLLWADYFDKGQDVFQELLSCIEDCASYGISTLVMHPENKSGTKTVPLPSDFALGIERMKRITDTAECLNVNIAVENMSHHEYLDCIFQNIHSERLGFCFDSRHCNVFTPAHDLLSQYGNRLMALHLHDNNGVDDWHSLPFSGNICWSDIAKKLQKESYDGAVSLEVGMERQPSERSFMKF